MSVGDGIFLSAILLSIVGLYAATKDRWKWKRIAKWGIGLPISLAVVVGLGLWAYYNYDGRPKIQAEFGGIKLSSTQADVKFLKGEPIEKHSDAERWVYSAQSGSGQPEDAVYIIQFRDSKIRHITYWASERQIVNPWVHGFSVGSTYDEVLEKLGQPSHVSISADGLNRLLSFEKYQTFYEFTQGKVRSYGIYSPARGPMKFTKEAEVSAPPASSASGV